MPNPDADSPRLPPDHATRQEILTDLDTSLLVEASAGTGKTTSMVGRMIALVREGRAEIGRMAAVTFTRKAAAELRGRFQAAIEQAVSAASGVEKERLEAGLRGIDACYIGTIHGFCARLLRERPVEAAVDPGFTILEPDVDAVLRDEAWREHVAALYAGGDPALSELLELGLEPGELRAGFDHVCESLDVEWPAPPLAALDPTPVAASARRQLAHAAALIRTAGGDPGNDRLLQVLARFAVAARHRDLATPLGLFEALSECSAVTEEQKFVLKLWPGANTAEKRQARERERACWNSFFVESAAPYVDNWYARRYHAALRVLRPALDIHAGKRRLAGGLNNQDLLIKAAALLRGHQSVRAYFHQRLTHLLVDEFQDTDPIQAEVMLLLTAENCGESKWTRCRPRPGSLFVVGDPKQSIYRFRRADMSTYQSVKQILEAAGGRTLTLSANFRSSPEIIGWVNGAFRSRMGAETTVHQPAYSPIVPGRQEGAGGAVGLFRNVLESKSLTGDQVAALDAEGIARTIHAAIAEGAHAADFLVLTRKKRRLADYARALQHLDVPVRITGGVFAAVDELRLLGAVLRAAIDVHDPVALVAALRGEAFGVGDATLHAWHAAGHAFSVFAGPGAEGDGRFDAVVAALSRLRRYAAWIRRLPPGAAFRRIAADLGVAESAACQAGGNVQSGTLLRALEVLRVASAALTSPSQLLDELERLRDGDTDVESTPALPELERGVRVMNLHKAKGLEAPVVFLADPTGAGGQKREPEIHIDRQEGGRGYLCIREATGDGRHHAAVLARPFGWELKQAEESRFLDAEETRLLYVAATRAGRSLIVSCRDSNPNRSPWNALEDDLQSFAASPAPPAPAPRPPTAAGDGAVEALERAAERAVRRWHAAQQPSYRVGAAKALAAATSAAGRLESAMDPHRGAAWGSVIHSLLEAAMRGPGRDLLELSRALLAGENLPMESAGDAVKLVASVTRSALWQRALQAKRRWTEVPFEHVQQEKMPGGTPSAVLVRGVIDLVFEEPGGWVIVDYKTDALAERSPAEVKERYTGQLDAYREAWTQITGEPVQEVGLFLTRTGAYVASRC